MSERPYFSLFGPAIRPQYYEDNYNNISNGNNIPFEIVFVGNVPPRRIMPDNFRYIYSEASPAQCWDIAARETNGVLMISSGDDIKYSKNFLNRAYYYTTIFDLDKTLISFRYRYQWGPNYNGLAIDEGGFFKFGEPGFSVLGASGIFRKDLWIKLGGLDNRFFGSFADIDITFRHFYELGMNFFIPPDCFIIEIPKDRGEKRGSNLIARSDPISLLDSLWIKDGVFSKKRVLDVRSFIYE
jgi:hypothetical protein